jgi:hypothetical protein
LSTDETGQQDDFSSTFGRSRRRRPLRQEFLLSAWNSCGYPCQEGGVVIKRIIAALVLALTIVPLGGAAMASVQTDKVACLFYQTFREREITDCL